MQWTRILLVVIAFQAVLLAGKWGSSPVTPADAQVPAAFNQTEKVVDELRTLNGKVDKLIEMLDSGKLQVKVAQADESKEEKK